MTGQWMTYEEAGERFGLSPEAIRKRSRRLGWEVEPSNTPHARARILVPDDAELPAGRPPGHRSEVRPDDRLELLAETRLRAEAAEAKLSEALALVRHLGQMAYQDREEGRQREATHLRDIAQEVARAERAETELTAERRRAEETQARLDAADAQLAEVRAVSDWRAEEVAEARERSARAEAGKADAEAQLAAWTDGGPLARAVRALFWRRG